MEESPSLPFGMDKDNDAKVKRSSVICDSHFMDDLSSRVPLPLDGGYGWVVMVASAATNMLVDGLCYTFGLFYMDFHLHFKASKAKTAWVGSICCGTYLCIGPIAGALANKYGCRIVTILGSLLATFSLLVSTFSPTIDVLILTYGGLLGVGFGMMYLPAIVMVGFYFEKKRAFATGISVCGSGIGGFLFAPLIDYILRKYGWQGTTWIIAGIIFNGTVCGSLFRPIALQKANKRYANAAEAWAQDKDSDSFGKTISKFTKLDTSINEGGTIEVPPSIEPPRSDGDATSANVFMHGDAGISTTAAAAAVAAAAAAAVAVRPTAAGIDALQPAHHFSVQYLTSSYTEMCDHNVKIPSFSKSADDFVSRQRVVDKEQTERRLRDLQRPLYRKNIFYSGSVIALPEYRSKLDMQSYVRSMTTIPEEDVVREGAGQEGCRKRGAFKEMCDTLQGMLDLSLLKHPAFCIYNFACFMCMSGFYVPYMYLPDYAIIDGVSRTNAAYLLSIIGVFSTLSRVATGWISDRPWADCFVISNTALVIGGVSTMLCPCCNTFPLKAFYSIVYGISTAAFVSLRSIIMVRLLGINRLTNAFGLLCMSQGIGALIGGPIAGALFDLTGSCDISFYLAGAMMTTAGGLCCCLRRVSDWHKRKTTKRLEELYSSSVECPKCT